MELKIGFTLYVKNDGDNRVNIDAITGYLRTSNGSSQFQLFNRSISKGKAQYVFYFKNLYCAR